MVMIEEVSPSPSVFVSLRSSRFLSFSRPRDRTSEQASGQANQINNFNFLHGLGLIDRALSQSACWNFFYVYYWYEKQTDRQPFFKHDDDKSCAAYGVVRKY